MRTHHTALIRLSAVLAIMTALQKGQRNPVCCVRAKHAHTTDSSLLAFCSTGIIESEKNDRGFPLAAFQDILLLSSAGAFPTPLGSLSPQQFAIHAEQCYNGPPDRDGINRHPQADACDMKKARFWIGILISIIALAFAFRQVDFTAVWASLAGVNYWLLALSVVILLVFLYMRAFRWRLLFYPKQGLKIRNLFSVINIGYLLSNIFPARLGDVARAYLIGDTEDVSRASAFSTVVAERVLDALCAVLAFFIVLPFAPLPDWMIRAGSIVGVVAVIAVILFVILVRRKEWTLRLIDGILRAIHWPSCETMSRFWQGLARRTRLKFLADLPWVERQDLESMAGSLIDGFSGITTLRLGPPLLFWSVAIWTTISAFYWVVLLAFDQSQPFVAGVAVASVTALGMTVPSSPGYIGVFEMLTRETMVIFGMTPEAALSYGLVAHAIVYVFFTLMGLLGMAQQNMSYSKIQERISEEAETPATAGPASP